MVSIDKIAIGWSVAIVAIAIGLTFTASNDDIAPIPVTIPDKITLDEPYKPAYSQDDRIVISGNVGEISEGHHVSIQVLASNGNLVTVMQVLPDSDGDFEAEIVAGGPLWRASGEYKIIAFYDGQETSINFIFR